MTVSYAHVRTNNASEYAAQLTRDWMKSGLPVVRDQAHAAITLPFGYCEFDADKEFLDIKVTADTIAHTTLFEDIVSDRLDRLSQGEPLRYAWILLPEAPRARSQ